MGNMFESSTSNSIQLKSEHYSKPEMIPGQLI